MAASKKTNSQFGKRTGKGLVQGTGEAAPLSAAGGADNIDQLIAARLLALRTAQSLSLAQLADRSGVSKAMISRIERGESSPTATILGRLAAGLGVSLAQLLTLPEPAPQRLRRRAQQTVWSDRQRRYRRRQVVEHDPRTGIELVEVELPRAARVRYPKWSGRSYRQRLWLITGALRIDYGEERFVLAAGDCLDFGVDRAVAFRALGATGCHYVLLMSAA